MPNAVARFIYIVILEFFNLCTSASHKAVDKLYWMIGYEKDCVPVFSFLFSFFFFSPCHLFTLRWHS